MKRIMLFVLALLAFAQGLHAQNGVVSEVKLIGATQEAQINELKSAYRQNGWTIIESNLNAGTKGDYIYLCYKKSNGPKSCITDLYLSSSNEATRKLVETITVDGKTYTLCPFEGGGHFEGVYGDLNSFNGGADIHLYYTKSSFGDGRAVTDIWFNSKSDGAVGRDQSGKPYDLNTGAGGDDIFMHFSTKSNSVKTSSGKYISEVKLIGASQAQINELKSTYKNNGWTVIESNLNAGTKGDHIYLCYKRSDAPKSCITNLYLSSSNEATRKLVETITVDGKTYTLCPFEGGVHFEGVYGDLNSYNGGADIHLYYTKSSFADGRVVTDIWFNSKSDGAVGKDQSGKPYDLNTGAVGNDIFMHFSAVNR